MVVGTSVVALSIGLGPLLVGDSVVNMASVVDITGVVADTLVDATRVVIASTVVDFTVVSSVVLCIGIPVVANCVGVVEAGVVWALVVTPTVDTSPLNVVRLSVVKIVEGTTFSLVGASGTSEVASFVVVILVEKNCTVETDGVEAFVENFSVVEASLFVVPASVVLNKSSVVEGNCVDLFSLVEADVESFVLATGVVT